MKMKNLKNLAMYHLAKETNFNNEEIIMMKGFDKLRISAIEE
jgi:hypothetical protein